MRSETVYILVLMACVYCMSPCGCAFFCQSQEWNPNTTILTYHLHDIKDRCLSLNILNDSELIISNFSLDYEPLPHRMNIRQSAWHFEDCYKYHYLHKENAIVLDLLTRTSRAEREKGPLLKMFEIDSPTCYANVLPVLENDTMYLNQSKTMIWYKGLFFKQTSAINELDNSTPWFPSTVDREIKVFKSLYGFLPHKYVYCDGVKRNLTIEFLSPDTIAVKNVDFSCSQAGDLSFCDYYLIAKWPDNNALIVKSLISTSRKSICKCKQLKPFRSSESDCSECIFNIMSNDTLFVSSCANNKDKHIAINGLVFDVAGSGEFGEWHTNNKQLQPIISEEKLKLLCAMLNEGSAIDPYYKYFLKFCKL